MDQITIVLSRAADDPQVGEPKFQEELRGFSKSLRATGYPSRSGQSLSIRSMPLGIRSLSLWLGRSARLSSQRRRLYAARGFRRDMDGKCGLRSAM